MQKQKTSTQKMVGFGTAIANFWKKYGSFSGCATRAEYWWAMLFVALVAPAFLIPVLGQIGALAFIVPMYALASRRFHDAGFSAKWIFIPLLTVAVPSWIFLGISFAAHAAYEFEVMYFFNTLYSIFSFVYLGFSVFYFVVSLLPSKLSGNKYRK